MKVVNLSSYPTDEVRRLVRLAGKGLNHKKVVVTVYDSVKRVQTSRLGEGRKIYCRGWATFWAVGSGDVEVYLAPEGEYPFAAWKRHRSGPLTHDWKTWQEALLGIGAHELKHCDLGPHSHSTSQQMEMACTAHHHWVLTKFRAGEWT